MIISSAVPAEAAERMHDTKPEAIEPTDAELEDHITVTDFWQECVDTKLGDQLAHLMTIVDPVGINQQPSTADILSAWNALRALKRMAMDKAREVL